MSSAALNPAQVERLQAAADWFLRLKEAPQDSVITAWMEWCEADPHNLTAFEEIRSIWMATDESAPGVAISARPVGQTRRRWRPARAFLLAAAVAGALVSTAWVLYGPLAGPPKQVLSTPLAVHSESVLEDGSRLSLGALSRVSTQFSARERLVVVETGEAYFDVAKDANRPFVVRAGSLSVTAVGTAFNVRQGVGRVVVTVTEGRVGIASERREPVLVEAGQQITYSKAEHRFAVAPVDSELANSWQRGVFKYVREPLVDVVADLNRYRERRIVIEDATLGSERYTGTVFGNRMEDWLVALQSAFSVRVSERGDTVVLKRADASARSREDADR